MLKNTLKTSDLKQFNFTNNKSTSSDNEVSNDNFETDDTKTRLRHNTDQDHHIDPSLFRLNYTEFLHDGNNTLSLIESTFIGWIYNTQDSTDPRDESLKDTITDQLSTNQQYYDLNLMVLQRMIEGYHSDSKVPSSILSFVNNMRERIIKSSQGNDVKDSSLLNKEELVVEIDDGSNEEIDEWLNDKGLDIFLFEFKQGNMIGAHNQNNLSYLENISDIFESRVILQDDQFRFLNEQGTEYKETIQIIDNGDQNQEAMLPRVNKHQKGQQVGESSMSGLKLLFSNVLKECDSLSNQVIIEYSEQVQHLNAFSKEINRIIDQQKIDNLVKNKIYSDDDSISKLCERSINKMIQINQLIMDESINFDKKWNHIQNAIIQVEIETVELWRKEKIKNIIFDLLNNEIESRITNAKQIQNIFKTVGEQKLYLSRDK